MLAPEQGPFVLDDLPLPPRVSDTYSFVALGALLDGVAGAADPLLGPQAVATADARPGVDVGGVFAGTIAPAEDTNAAHVALPPDGTLASSVDAGAAVPMYQGAVAPYLPPPDTGIPSNFRDPPPDPRALGVSTDTPVPHPPGPIENPN